MILQIRTWQTSIQTLVCEMEFEHMSVQLKIEYIISENQVSETWLYVVI